MSFKFILVIGSTVLVTVVITLLVLNMTTGEKQITQKVQHHYDAADPQFLRAMGVLLGPALVGENRVDTLQNGEQIFSSMLQAIRSAKKTITFETYIYWSGDIGKTFAEALSERAQSGVKVYVLLDAVGSQKLDQDSLNVMRNAGVEVEIYHPIRWYTLGKLNNRTHRLPVTDGESALRAASALRTNGGETQKILTTGATLTTESRVPLSHKCKQRSWITGPR